MDGRRPLPCRITELTENDIARVADHYDALTMGLGTMFIHEISRILVRVADFPFANARVHAGVRRVRIGRFPYFAAYTVDRDEFVVLGVFAEPQHPRNHLTRLGVS